MVCKRRLIRTQPPVLLVKHIHHRVSRLNHRCSHWHMQTFMDQHDLHTVHGETRNVLIYTVSHLSSSSLAAWTYHCCQGNVYKIDVIYHQFVSRIWLPTRFVGKEVRTSSRLHTCILVLFPFVSITPSFSLVSRKLSPCPLVRLLHFHSRPVPLFLPTQQLPPPASFIVKHLTVTLSSSVTRASQSRRELITSLW